MSYFYPMHMPYILVTGVQILITWFLCTSFISRITNHRTFSLDVDNLCCINSFINCISISHWPAVSGHMESVVIFHPLIKTMLPKSYWQYAVNVYGLAQ